MNEELTKQDHITNQANEGWARFILAPFNRILEDQRCGMKMDLMKNSSGQTVGMVMVLTAGNVPPFSLTYGAPDVK
jgi:hypothetical protein